MHCRTFARIPPLLLLATLCACGPNTGGGTDGGTDGGTVKTRHYTFRALAGVSMGAMGTAAIGPRHPDRFDAFGALGGPYDVAYMLHFIQTEDLGGFCSYDDLLKILADHPGDTNILNDKSVIDACAIHLPTTQPFEHPSSFNDWWFDDNGGTFDRSSYIDLFEDLSMAFGNPAFYNPTSKLLPPGVDDSWTCDKPAVIKGTDHGGTSPIYNAEYNPDGRFDVITFCDGEEPITVCQQTGKPVDFCSGETPDQYCGADGPAVTPGGSVVKNRWPDTYYAEKGAYDPCRPHTKRIRIALAVDMDGDGKRDYGEPVIVNAEERYQDVGIDGCPDPKEDGAGGCTTTDASPYDPVANPDPNGDDYSWQKNPTGTENDWRHEDGEPFDDYGLDGVPNTGDYGEGNGVFDVSPNEKYAYSYDARTNIRAWSEKNAKRIDFWLDGGIRDIFNFDVNSSQVFGELSARESPSKWYQQFISMPNASGSWAGSYDFQQVDMSKVPDRAMVLYGDPNATNKQWRQNGNGAHVGTGAEVVNRMETFFGWLSSRWPGGDYKPTTGWSFNTYVKDESYHSDALGSDRDYAIALPPGYFDDANKNETYPVVYFLHGYGMGPDGMAALSILYDGFMGDGIMQKMIIVYVDGRCCFVNASGQRDCNELPGRTIPAGFVRECHAGSFYVNSAEDGSGGSTRYEDSLFDLMDHIDAAYRTKPAADVKVP